jgi:hypothetical protein
MFTKSIIVPLVIFIIYLVYKLFLKPKLKSPKKATIIEVGIVLILLPLYQIYLQDYITKDEKKAFNERLLAAVKEQGFEIEKYKERIKELHKQTYQSSDEDAEKWAVNFLSTVNIRKDKIKQQKEEARIIKEKELINLPIVFDYILYDFDSKINALKETSQKIQLTKIDTFDLVVYDSTQSITIREVIFENGNSLKLTLKQGSRDEFFIKEYPEICFSETTKNLSRQKVSFRIKKRPMGVTVKSPEQKPLIEDIYYVLEGDDYFLNDRFKKSFSDTFQKALEAVFMGDY